MNALLLAEEGNHFWLPHDINEVIWGTIAFLIVFGLLYKKAWPAISAAMAARPERIAAELGAAEADRVDAESKRDGVKAALADSDAEAARIVAEARDAAARLESDTVTRAEAEAVALRERAAGEFVAARRQAESDLAGELSRLALGAAEQVVHSNLDDATHQDLIEAYIRQVGATN
jgi:F-type H+-transporting ATPase subunit b